MFLYIAVLSLMIGFRSVHFASALTHDRPLFSFYSPKSYGFRKTMLSIVFIGFFLWSYQRLFGLSYQFYFYTWVTFIALILCVMDFDELLVSDAPILVGILGVVPFQLYGGNFEKLWMGLLFGFVIALASYLFAYFYGKWRFQMEAFGTGDIGVSIYIGAVAGPIGVVSAYLNGCSLSILYFIGTAVYCKRTGGAISQQTLKVPVGCMFLLGLLIDLIAPYPVIRSLLYLAS